MNVSDTPSEPQKNDEVEKHTPMTDERKEYLREQGSSI